MARKGRAKEAVQDSDHKEDGADETNGKGSKKRSTKEVKKLYKRALTEAYKEMVKEVEKGAGAKSTGKAAGKPGASEKLKIDFDGISRRILAIPVGEGATVTSSV